jgi:hypothetical protein
VAQVVDLSSNPSTAKNKDQKLNAMANKKDMPPGPRNYLAKEALVSREVSASDFTYQASNIT